MTTKAVIRIAQVATGDILLTDVIREGRELYAPGALTLGPNPKVLVNHDLDRVIGRVTALETWPDTDGLWVHARCDLDDVPEWLRGGAYQGSGASMAWIDLGTCQRMPAGWTRFNKGMVTEVSVLSPSVSPVETRAKVVILERHHPTGLGSADRDGDVIWGGPTLHRFFPGAVTGVR